MKNKFFKTFESFMNEQEVLKEGLFGNHIEDYEKSMQKRYMVAGKGEIKISKKKFLGQTDLKFIQIADSVTEIGDQAFDGCLNLENVEFPENENLKKIGDGAFYSCVRLKEAALPNSVESLGRECFERTKSLETSNIPENLKVIPYKCFEYSGIVRIYLSDRIQKIEREAFGYCENLKKISFPANLRIIESRAFEGCSSLRFLELPRGIRKIGYNAFADCPNLEEVLLRFPYNGIQTMWNPLDLFRGNKSLKKVYCEDRETFKVMQQMFKDLRTKVKVVLAESMPEIIEIIKKWMAKGFSYSVERYTKI